MLQVLKWIIVRGKFTRLKLTKKGTRSNQFFIFVHYEIFNEIMKDLLKQYENKLPEIVFNWKDSETEAEGWTVINSLRGGAAGG